MTRLIWDQTGDRIFETGLDRGVLYTTPNNGVPWNGLTEVDENPAGGGAIGYYMDGIRYLNVASGEEFVATLSAYTYPDEFLEFDGVVGNGRGLFFTQQTRKPFGLSYRTTVGNDIAGTDYAYKIHLVYNILATPSTRNNQSTGENVEAQTFNWSLSTTPVPVSGRKPTAHLIIDSRETEKYLLQYIEDILYGSKDQAPRLPSPAELVSLYDSWAVLVVTDHGDGSFTVSGPDAVVKKITDAEYQFNWDSVIQTEVDTFTLTTH